MKTELTPHKKGREKVARMLLDFFKSDPTARIWFLRKSAGSAPPRVKSVVHAASYEPQIVPGGIATVFGENLAEDSLAAGKLPLPRQLLGTVVLVDGQPAWLYYVSPALINFVVPRDVETGQLVVAKFDLESEPYVANAVPAAPAFFWWSNQDGQLIAAATHPGDGIVSESQPVRSQGIVELYCTGLGASLGDPGSAQVLVAGTPVQVLYAGPAPGFPGLEQINIELPRINGVGLQLLPLVI